MSANRHATIIAYPNPMKYTILPVISLYILSFVACSGKKDPSKGANTPVPHIDIPLRQQFGINGFEWNFEDGPNSTVIDTGLIRAAQSFTAFRHYLDWEKLEQTRGSYTFNPTRDGGWNYDALYEACRRDNIFVLADIKTIPAWIQSTWPADERDAENVPIDSGGADYDNPNAYTLQAKLAFQFAARYGSNPNVDPSLLSVNTTPRWTADPVNTVKIGLNLVHYVECDNERDKWWKGKKAHQTGEEYAANLSAFYDGNKNTLGKGVGVKNADPNMKVVMAGVANTSTEFLQGMIDWCIRHRGYNADSSINLCWDVINFHYYADNSHGKNDAASRGIAPELSKAADIATDFIKLAHQYARDMPVWVTECGYDINPGSTQKAIGIGNKTALETQADWILRTALLYERCGVARTFFYEMYDDHISNPTRYQSCGLINGDKSRKPAADYLVQANRLMGNYVYKKTISNQPIVDQYEQDGKYAYVLVSATENATTMTYALRLTGATSATIYTPTPGQDSMRSEIIAVPNNIAQLRVSETPIFVIPMLGQDSRK
jgi:endoglucanase